MGLGAGWDSGEKLNQYVMSQADQSLHCCPPPKGLRRDVLRTQETWHPNMVLLICYHLSRQQESLIDSPTAKERRGDWDNTWGAPSSADDGQAALPPQGQGNGEGTAWGWDCCKDT